MIRVKQTTAPDPEPVGTHDVSIGKPDIVGLTDPGRPLRVSDAVVTRNGTFGRRLGQFLEHYEQRIFACGIRLELSTDFELLADINPHLEKAPLTPQFDPAVSDIGPVNGFWLKGVDARGEVMLTLAVRHDDLGHGTLAGHLKSLRAFYADPARSAHPDEACAVSAPAAYTITGRLCYTGEFWIKTASGQRGHELSFDTPRVALAIATARWDPDFVYATVHPGIVEKGVLGRYGYRNAQPDGIRWNIPRTGELLDEWLIWMARRDLVELVEGRFA